MNSSSSVAVQVVSQPVKALAEADAEVETVAPRQSWLERFRDRNRARRLEMIGHGGSWFGAGYWAYRVFGAPQDEAVSKAREFWDDGDKIGAYTFLALAPIILMLRGGWKAISAPFAMSAKLFNWFWYGE